MSLITAESESDKRFHPHLLARHQQHTFLHAQLLGHLRRISSVPQPGPRNRAGLRRHMRKNIASIGHPFLHRRIIRPPPPPPPGTISAPAAPAPAPPTPAGPSASMG